MLELENDQKVGISTILFPEEVCPMRNPSLKRCTRDGFAELALRLGYQFKTYTYIHKKGRNKLPLQVALIGRRDMVHRWMEEIGSISDTHLKRCKKWVRILGIW
jgi:hypothetical protein